MLGQERDCDAVPVLRGHPLGPPDADAYDRASWAPPFPGSPVAVYLRRTWGEVGASPRPRFPLGGAPLASEPQLPLIGPL